MIDVRCHLEDGNSYVTRFNGTYEEAVSYFVGNLYEYLYQPTTKVKRVELLYGY